MAGRRGAKIHSDAVSKVKDPLTEQDMQFCRIMARYPHVYTVREAMRECEYPEHEIQWAFIMRRKNIKEQIQIEKEDIAKILDMTKDDAVSELKRLAYGKYVKHQDRIAAFKTIIDIMGWKAPEKKTILDPHENVIQVEITE